MDPGFLEKAFYVSLRKWNKAIPTYYIKQYLKYHGDDFLFLLQMVDFKILSIFKTTNLFKKHIIHMLHDFWKRPDFLSLTAKLREEKFM